MTAAKADIPLADVAIVGLPIEIHRRASDHHATLMREFALIAASSDPDSVPARLLAVSEELSSRYSGFTTGPQAALEGAMHNGDDTIDLHYELPLEIAEAAEHFDNLLDEVEEFCRAGDMLTLVAASDGRAYRKWFLGEFVLQIRHRALPLPWPGAGGAAEAVDKRSEDRLPSRGVDVDDDLDLEGAADLRATIAELIDQGVTDLVLDLSGCSFLDSVGISLLLTTRARLTDRGGSLSITNPTRQVRKTLQHAGILDLFLAT